MRSRSTLLRPAQLERQVAAEVAAAAPPGARRTDPHLVPRGDAAGTPTTMPAVRSGLRPHLQQLATEIGTVNSTFTVWIRRRWHQQILPTAARSAAKSP